MDNTQRVWILYVILLSLNFLATKRHWIMETAGLSQPIYFNNVLTSKCKSKDMMHLGTGYAFISIGNERLCVNSFQLKKN